MRSPISAKAARSAAAKNAGLYSRAVQALLNDWVEVEELEEHLTQSTLKKLAATGTSSNREKTKIVSQHTRPSKPTGSSKTARNRSELDNESASKPDASNTTMTRPHYDCSIKVEFVGHTQPFLVWQRIRTHFAGWVCAPNRSSSSAHSGRDDHVFMSGMLFRRNPDTGYALLI